MTRIALLDLIVSFAFVASPLCRYTAIEELTACSLGWEIHWQNVSFPNLRVLRAPLPREFIAPIVAAAPNLEQVTCWADACEFLLRSLLTVLC